MVSRSGLSRFLCAIVVSVVVCVAGCSKDSPTSDGNGSGDGIKTGAATTYPIDAAGAVQVKEETSGLTFSFPDGGKGTLSVAPVTTSPDLGLAAKKVEVSYSGSGNVEVLVPKTAGGEDLVFVYSRRPGIMVDDFDGEYSWWGIAPLGERDGALAYSLTPMLEIEAAAKSAAGAASDGGMVLAIASLAAGSTEAARIASLRTSVAQAVEWWLANLPSSLSATARAQVEGDLKYGLVFTSSGNVYDHSRHTFGPDANIELCISSDTEKGANAHTVAHEVGHYMNHVLVGYDRYVEILDRMPTTWWGGIAPHGFSDYNPTRKYVTEEYAFLSDALINGTVDANDIIQPLTQSVFAGKGPDARDFPSHEGFGVFMLGALLRTDPKVVCFWPKAGKIPAPVVGASKSDVLALVARGARDTNELRQVIQDYLDTRPADRLKLPAMLEPIGWSYNGGGTIVDKENKPVKGAHVQSISRDGAAEYRTFTSLTTGDDGVFSLSRIYPGTNILRIFWNGDKDSTDVAFTADWSKPTNEALKMGTFKIDTSPAIQSFTVTKTFQTKVGWGDAESDLAAILDGTLTWTISGPGITPELYEGTGIYLIPQNVPVTVTIETSITKTTVNEKNPYGAIFTVGDPVINPLVSGTITKYGGVQVTDKRTASHYEVEFMFTEKSGASLSLGSGGYVTFEVGGIEKDEYVVWMEKKNVGGGVALTFWPK